MVTLTDTSEIILSSEYPRPNVKQTELGGREDLIPFYTMPLNATFGDKIEYNRHGSFSHWAFSLLCKIVQ